MPNPVKYTTQIRKAAQKFEPVIHHFIVINNENKIRVSVAKYFLNQIKKNEDLYELDRIDFCGSRPTLESYFST